MNLSCRDDNTGLEEGDKWGIDFGGVALLKVDVVRYDHFADLRGINSRAISSTWHFRHGTALCKHLPGRLSYGVAKLIEISPPRSSWANDFNCLKQVVLRAAPFGAYIHHIGSTAVPGLAAKDVIDVQITVDRLNDIDPQAFIREGFEHVPGLVDHRPPSIILPDAELEKHFFRNTGRPANIHVRAAGRFNQRFAIICRDYLRSHPTTANAYQLIKQRLANRFPTDHAAYYEIKDPIFDIIVDGAEEWAKAAGWSEPPPD